MEYKASFLLGLPDDKKVKVAGVTKNGDIMYRLTGNCEFHNYLNIPEKNKNSLLIVWFEELPKIIQNTDIIINCITDQDSTAKSLKKAITITNSVKKTHPNVAIFNDPTKIAATTRDNIYKNFHSLSGIYIPKVVRVTPSSTKNLLDLAKEHELRAPFLVRPCGSHESQNLTLIDTKEKISLLERYAYDGSEFYLTEFVDYKSKDQLYHKARLVMIGGKIYPRHYMTGESWMVHGNLHQTYMAKNKIAKQQELNFINNFQNMLSPAAIISFHEIYKRVGLDYLGFDFAIMKNGNALIFEINPAQNTFSTLDFKYFPYMQSVRDNIINGFNEAVIAKVKNKKL